MFFNPDGSAAYPAKVVKTLDWSVLNDSALPSWLAQGGASSILTFTAAAAGDGRVRATTKSSSPAINDQASIATAFNIDTSKFAEISFVVYGLISDGDTTGAYVSIEQSDTSTGVSFYSSPGGAGQSVFKVKPSITKYPSWQFVAESNSQRRKDIGITIRPATKEVFITAGDPYEGAGVIAYDKGNWVNTINPFKVQTQVATTAAQRYVEFSRVKLRTVSY